MKSHHLICICDLRHHEVRVLGDMTMTMKLRILVSMLELFFAVAFSAVPLTLYVPPIRSLNLFVESIELLVRPTAGFSIRTGPRLRGVFSRFLSALLHNQQAISSR
ncbi:hypothetical protein Leryth_001149 [Lithospermum erythrorhizon]|uniref:Uncharacterized protein n=1 Tax=Lithospermum erythrorhizon TaxID=34254 RepID=A0AAV3NHR5_LITER|nr:hypothetical protein Leryth_001149 [Lithospermum erythrorhizon]